jgi:hypothetical protein
MLDGFLQLQYPAVDVVQLLQQQEHDIQGIPVDL